MSQNPIAQYVSHRKASKSSGGKKERSLAWQNLWEEVLVVIRKKVRFSSSSFPNHPVFGRKGESLFFLLMEQMDNMVHRSLRAVTVNVF